MQADCICIVYLCVPVCVVEDGGANNDPGLESATRFQSLIAEKHDGAFNLNLTCFKLAPLQRGVPHAAREALRRGGGAEEVQARPRRLKAPQFQTLIVKRAQQPFQLEPFCFSGELAPLRRGPLPRLPGRWVGNWSGPNSLFFFLVCRPPLPSENPRFLS